MGYPTAAQTFGTKNPGDAIQSAHINTLQTEVAAIEDGLLNGLQHPLTISTGGLTVVGTITATAMSIGGVPVALGGRFPSAILAHSAGQSIANNTWTALSWDTETADSTTLHDTASNSSRLRLTSSGLWLLGGQVTWNIGANPSTLRIGARITANDTQGVMGDERFLGAWPSTTIAQSVSGLFYATDTASHVTLQAYQTTGGNHTVLGSTGTGSGPTQFWAVRVSS